MYMARCSLKKRHVFAGLMSMSWWADCNTQELDMPCTSLQCPTGYLQRWDADSTFCAGACNSSDAEMCCFRKGFASHSWRIVASSPVGEAWDLLALRFYLAENCSADSLIEAVPSSRRGGANGAAFSHHRGRGAVAADLFHEPVQFPSSVPQLQSVRWSSGAPCTAGECFVGFSWESDGTRHRRGTTAEIVRACALHVEDPRGELQADARLPNGWLCPAGRCFPRGLRRSRAKSRLRLLRREPPATDARRGWKGLQLLGSGSMANSCGGKELGWWAGDAAAECRVSAAGMFSQQEVSRSIWSALQWCGSLKLIVNACQEKGREGPSGAPEMTSRPMQSDRDIRDAIDLAGKLSHVVPLGSCHVLSFKQEELDAPDPVKERKTVSLKTRTLEEQIVAKRYDRALERFAQQQEEWEKFRHHASRKTGRDKEELVVTRAEEYRERLEVMELLDRATPEEIKSGGFNWYHSLRGEGTRFIQVGNMFSGLYLPMKLHKENFVHEIIRKPLLVDLTTARHTAEASGKKKPRSWRDDEYLLARIRKYGAKMKEMAPGQLEYDEIMEPEVKALRPVEAEMQEGFAEEDLMAALLEEGAADNTMPLEQEPLASAAFVAPIEGPNAEASKSPSWLMQI
ncbi:ssp2 [Symbiodinium sp. KB8]|nr:ssp2 [Symbiodinium sp. KB8]